MKRLAGRAAERSLVHVLLTLPVQLLTMIAGPVDAEMIKLRLCRGAEATLLTPKALGRAVSMWACIVSALLPLDGMTI